MLTMDLGSFLNNPPARSPEGLDISGQHLRDLPLADIQILGKILGDCDLLTSLYLDQNGIGTFQSLRIQSLFQPLSKCPKLSIISLGKNHLSQSSLGQIQILGEALGNCAQLTHLNLDVNEIGRFSPLRIKYLFQPLSRCRRLTTIFLSNNQLGQLSDEGIYQLCIALNNIPSDLRVHLDNHGFSQDQMNLFLRTYSKINFLSGQPLVPEHQQLLKNRYLGHVKERAGVVYHQLASLFPSGIMNLIFQYLCLSENYSPGLSTNAISDKEISQAIEEGFKSAAPQSSHLVIPGSAGDPTARLFISPRSDNPLNLSASFEKLSLDNKVWTPLHQQRQRQNRRSLTSARPPIPRQKVADVRRKKR